MPTLQTMESSILSLIVLIFIYAHAYNRLDRAFLEYRLFMSLVTTNIALIIIDILGWIFNGLAGPINFWCNLFFNLLLYITEPIGPILWILYIKYQLDNQDVVNRAAVKKLLLLFGINMILSVSSLQTGWFFTVDAANIYHRGNLFWLHASFCYLLLLYALFRLVKNRKKVEKRRYYTLLFYYLPQSIGTTIQMFHYGVSFNWSGMMLSLLVIYLNLQDYHLHIDYLTGVYNRRQLDKYIKSKMQKCTQKQSFSGILIDLDKFKKINDSFGHKVGDEALQNAVNLIKKCTSRNDFIARYGGDEFFIISQMDTHSAMQEFIEKIHRAVKDFNQSQNKQYELQLSIGYEIYDWSKQITSDEFFKKIDLNMYENKKRST